jgi:hypothetical protein
MEVAVKGVTGGILKPDEGRKRFNLAKVPGGDQVYMQKQNWPLTKLGTNSAPPAPSVPPGDTAKPMSPAMPPPAKGLDMADLDITEIGCLLEIQSYNITEMGA